MAEKKMAASLTSSSFSEHESKLSDVVIDMEEAFPRSHNRRTEDFSGLYSIRPGRDFTKKGSSKGADHKQIKASLYGSSKSEKSSNPIIGEAPDHHCLNVRITGPKPKLVASPSHRGRPSLLWILRPKRLIFLFATLSSMGTMILIYLALLISKDNNPTM